METLEAYLGRAYLDLPDTTRALEYSRRALERVQGTGSPMEASLLNNIGGALHDQGGYAGAILHYRRALAICEKKLGPQHPHTRTVGANLARAAAQQSGWSPNGKRGGVVVLRCVRDACSGLLPGDWIVAYGPTKVRDTKHLIELTKATSAERSLRLSVVRDGKRLDLPAHGGTLGIEIH